MERLRKFSFKRKSRTQPYIVISNFEDVTEKDCIKYDRINDKFWSHRKFF